MELGQLPAQRHLPFSCPKVSELFQELDDTMRTLVQDDGARHLDEGSEAFLASFFVGEKTLEVKPVAGQPGEDQGRHKGRGPGKTFNVHTSLHAGPDEQESRVRDAGRPGIGAQGERRSGLQLGQDGFE